MIFRVLRPGWSVCTRQSPTTLRSGPQVSPTCFYRVGAPFRRPHPPVALEIDEKSPAKCPPPRCYALTSKGKGRTDSHYRSSGRRFSESSSGPAASWTLIFWGPLVLAGRVFWRSCAGGGVRTSWRVLRRQNTRPATGREY